jgi:hypothetical protein
MPNSFSVAFEGHLLHAISRPFSISNLANRVFFIERTFMCLVRANRFIGCFPGLKPWAKFFSPSGAIKQ